MTTSTKAAKFSWTDENTEKAVSLYTAKLEAEGVEVASSNDFLLEIAKEVGAVSERAVRGKLAKEGVYEKLDRPASVAKTNKVRKEHYVRALANTLNLDADLLDSFQNATAAALQGLTTALGIKDVMAAADKNYSPRQEMVVMNICEAFGLDVDDLETYQSELENA